MVRHERIRKPRNGLSGKLVRALARSLWERAESASLRIPSATASILPPSGSLFRNRNS